eukprot:g2920.t1
MVTTWKFVYDGDFRLLMLHHNLVEDTFSVFLDGRPQHTSKAQKSSRAWSVEIVLDGKTIPLKCNISASQPEKGRKKPFEYKLMLNDLPFVEAEQLFLKHIATRQLEQLQSGTKLQTEAHTPRSAAYKGTSGLAQPRPTLAETLDGFRNYSQTYWAKGIQESKTNAGFKKSTVTWNFTLHGMKHEVILNHSLFSNKRKVTLDKKVIAEDKPGAMASRDGLYQFKVGQNPHCTQCAVVLTGHKDSPPTYDLLIDNVPFTQCQKSIVDLAGDSTSPRDTTQYPTTRGSPAYQARSLEAVEPADAHGHSSSRLLVDAPDKGNSNSGGRLVQPIVENRSTTHIRSHDSDSEDETPTPA